MIPIPAPLKMKPIRPRVCSGGVIKHCESNWNSVDTEQLDNQVYNK